MKVKIINIQEEYEKKIHDVVLRFSWLEVCQFFNDFIFEMLICFTPKL